MQLTTEQILGASTEILAKSFWSRISAQDGQKPANTVEEFVEIFREVLQGAAASSVFLPLRSVNYGSEPLGELGVSIRHDLVGVLSQKCEQAYAEHNIPAEGSTRFVFIVEIPVDIGPVVLSEEQKAVKSGLQLVKG